MVLIVSICQYQYTAWVQTTASRLLTCFCNCICINTSAPFKHNDLCQNYQP